MLRYATTFLLMLLAAGPLTAQTTTPARKPATTSATRPVSTTARATAPPARPTTTATTSRTSPAARPASTTATTRSTTSRPATTAPRATTATAARPTPAATPAASQPAPATSPGRATTSSATTSSSAATTSTTRIAAPYDPASEAPAGLRVGVRGGINYLYDFNGQSEGLRQDYLGHGGLVFSLGRRLLAFQPELIYSREGLSFEQSGASASASSTTLTVPLLAKFSFGNPTATRFFVVVGPYATYVLQLRAKTTFGGTTQEEVLRGQDLGSFSDRLGYGATGGLGVALKLGPGHLTVEARGLWLLGTPERFEAAESATFQGSLGYLIPIGGR